jgi:hypothetical protein
MAVYQLRTQKYFVAHDIPVRARDSLHSFKLKLFCLYLKTCQQAMEGFRRSLPVYLWVLATSENLEVNWGDLSMDGTD